MVRTAKRVNQQVSPGISQAPGYCLDGSAGPVSCQAEPRCERNNPAVILNSDDSRSVK